MNLSQAIETLREDLKRKESECLNLQNDKKNLSEAIEILRDDLKKKELECQDLKIKSI